MAFSRRFYSSVGVGFWVLCVAVISWKLWSLPENSRALNFGFPATARQAMPLDLQPAAEAHTYVLDLEVNPSGSLQHSQDFILPVATYNGKAYVLAAEIRNSAGQCLARTTAGFFQKDNAKITLRSSACEENGPWTSQIQLVLKTKDNARLALWGSAGSVAEAKEDSVIRRLESTRDGVYYVQGEYAELLKLSAWNRVQLLNFIWGWDGHLSPGIIAAIVFAASLLGAILLTIRLKSHFWIAWLAFNSFGFFACLYAYIVPPLQAPDEPDHLLSYMHMTGSIKLEERFLEFAQKSHFERIKFHAHEIFTANDTLQPHSVPFADHVSDSDIANRSTILLRIWKTISPYFQNFSTGTHIFALRMLNVVICAASFACAVFLFGRSHERVQSPGPGLQSPLVWLFICCMQPILFFFAMHVSNYSLTLGFGLLGGALLKGSIDFTRVNPLSYGTVLGLALMGMLLSSASGISYAGFWIPFLILFPIFLNDPMLRNFRSYLMPLTLGLSLIATFVLGSFESLHVFNVETLQETSFWWQNKLGIALASIGCLPLSIYLQLFVTRFYRFNTLQISVRIVHLLACACAALAIFLPLLLSPHFLPNIEDPGMILSPAEYGFKVLRIMALNLGLGPVDFYLSSSFWGGIGWLESNFDNWFVVLSRTLIGVGVVIQLLFAQRRSDFRVMLFNLAVIVGLLAMLWGAAFVISRSSINLHGRYLIPFYLLLLAFSACGYLQFMKNISGNQRKVAFVVALLMTGFYHVYGISHILIRYFG